jgi:hypothetical protein
MGNKIIVMILGALVFAFGTASRSNAGTDTVEPYRAPAQTYNYAPPPPRPVVYAPPVRVGFFIGPGYGFYGPRFGFFPGPRFHRHHFWRGHPHHWY